MRKEADSTHLETPTICAEIDLPPALPRVVPSMSSPDTSRKTVARKPTMQADESDTAVLQALRAAPAWLKSMASDSEAQWQHAWNSAQQGVLDTIARCERLAARAQTPAWAEQLSRHAARLQQIVLLPCEPIPAKDLGIHLLSYELGEVIGSQRGKQPLQADLTLHVRWSEIKLIDFGGKVRTHDSRVLLRQIKESDEPSNPQMWDIEPVLEPRHVSVEHHERTWRFIVAPPGAGALKIFSHLKLLMSVQVGRHSTAMSGSPDRKKGIE